MGRNILTIGGAHRREPCDFIKPWKGVIDFALSGLNETCWPQVGINTSNSEPDPSAMLDVKSNMKGMLVPRMTAAERNAISNPANGLLIFCTDNNQYYTNKGSAASPNWMMMSSQWVTKFPSSPNDYNPAKRDCSSGHGVGPIQYRWKDVECF